MNITNGYLLDGYDPDKETLYSLFCQYFENPIMKKIKNTIHNNIQYSIYITKVHTLLGIKQRYIICIIYADNNLIGTEKKMEELKWISLQTRMLEEEHDIVSHVYTPRRLQGLDKKIIQRNKKEYVYDVESLPIQITLLPQTAGLDYTSHGTVVTAIETYHTIFTWLI